MPPKKDVPVKKPAGPPISKPAAKSAAGTPSAKTKAEPAAPQAPAKTQEPPVDLSKVVVSPSKLWLGRGGSRMRSSPGNQGMGGKMNEHHREIGGSQASFKVKGERLSALGWLFNTKDHVSEPQEGGLKRTGLLDNHSWGQG